MCPRRWEARALRCRSKCRWMDHRELAERPFRLEFRPVYAVGEIDEPLVEFDSVLIERDENLVTERRKRMVLPASGRYRLVNAAGVHPSVPPCRLQASLVDVAPA